MATWLLRSAPRRTASLLATALRALRSGEAERQVSELLPPASAAMTDVARFRAGDHPALVAAALCCQRCLGSPAVVIASYSRESATAWSWCESCDDHTEIHLDAAQLLRLRLAPPRELSVYLVSAPER